MKIKSETIARTIILFVALLNEILIWCGATPLNLDDSLVYELISHVWLVGSAVWAWWKNNSFTDNAKRADKYLDYLNNPITGFEDDVEE